MEVYNEAFGGCVGHVFVADCKEVRRVIMITIQKNKKGEIN